MVALSIGSHCGSEGHFGDGHGGSHCGGALAADATAVADVNDRLDPGALLPASSTAGRIVGQGVVRKGHVAVFPTSPRPITCPGSPCICIAFVIRPVAVGLRHRRGREGDVLAPEEAVTEGRAPAPLSPSSGSRAPASKEAICRPIAKESCHVSCVASLVHSLDRRLSLFSRQGPASMLSVHVGTSTSTPHTYTCLPSLL